MPPHLKRVLNQARLENESYDTMVQHLEKEMELNGLSAPTENNITGIHQIDVQEQQQVPKVSFLTWSLRPTIFFFGRVTQTYKFLF